MTENNKLQKVEATYLPLQPNDIVSISQSQDDLGGKYCRLVQKVDNENWFIEVSEHKPEWVDKYCGLKLVLINERRLISLIKNEPKS